MEDSTKKTRWRLNLFDIIFIAVIAIAAFLVISYPVGSGGIISPGTQETVVYTVEFQGMVGDTAELIRPGDALVDKIEKRPMGTVVSVETMPSRISQKDYVSGDRIIAVVPYLTDAVITVTAEATVTDSQISIGGFIVRAGARASVNGPLYHGNGFIIDIERGGE